MFVMIMLIAFVTGSLLGTVLVDKMMGSVWEYYEAVDVSVLSIAVSTLFLIATVTIGHKIRGVTVSNPVDALRHE